MPQRIVRIPGIEPLDLPEARQSIAPLHAYLRECILDGRVPPGTKLSQSTLADQLGVSRTPLREVLRMLQEEGLVEFEPNQRMRVTDLDPIALDSDYASRILLGTLSLSMTVATFGAVEHQQARTLLAAMHSAAEDKDVSGWFAAHNAYHRLFDTAAAAPLRRQLQVLADRSVRYIRIAQSAEPAHWGDTGDLEHPAILAAVLDGDVPGARAALARHLAGTALRVLAGSAPHYTPAAVPQAVEIVTGVRPAAHAG